MNNLKYHILMVASLLGIVAGCSTLTSTVEKLSEHTSDSVMRYCEQLDPDLRAVFRKKVNEELKGKARIMVSCYNEVTEKEIF